MSARQRHSRVPAPDGWTTIASPRKAKSKSAAASALLAHKSDLTNGAGAHDAAADESTPTEAEVAKVTARLQRQITAFNAASCCAKLKDLLRDELDIHRDTTQGSVETEGISNVLILALGSLSDSFGPAPGYQLAAALAIIDVLREHSTTMKKAMRILSYDPVYTALDRTVLSSFGISVVTGAQVPSDEGWYRRALVYMPHASVWLNHAYFMRRPRVWIGNCFAMYESAVTGLRPGEDGGDDEDGRTGKKDEGDDGNDGSGGGEVRGILREVRGVMEGYKRVEWPEEGWGGGAVFNNLVVYVRKETDIDAAGEEGDLTDAVAALTLEK
ncbi:hypothetical protein TWF696_003846 [Orbilia brochopaga]|uniref:SRR1-like domain-containing protein n=1 Tax=Orbilia brochopaga TaxID=3140254 RepID=A0AAV9V6Z3_9PEZI